MSSMATTVDVGVGVLVGGSESATMVARSRLALVGNGVFVGGGTVAVAVGRGVLVGVGVGAGGTRYHWQASPSGGTSFPLIAPSTTDIRCHCPPDKQKT